ncbi:MAG TPA: FUSC family protein [Solirubrobacteraceae bacterium]
MNSDRGQAILHSLALAIACLVTYWLAVHGLARLHSVSRADDVLGGIWAVIATVFVYRTSYDGSASAALDRMTATLLSFVLCLIYLLVLPVDPVGLAAMIGVSALATMLLSRPQDAVTAGITTAIVLGVASLSPHHVWQQPILRLADTALGTAVGLATAWIALRLTASEARGP